MRKLDIRPGDRFGKATVINTRINYHGHTVAGCRCDCGGTFSATGARLRARKVTQCPKCSRPVLETGERKLRQRESAYRCRAIQRGYEWSLTRDLFRDLLVGACHYCGITSAGGIDRKDNSIGYIETNSVACCADCNYAKLNKTEAQFLAWLLRLARHQGFSL